MSAARRRRRGIIRRIRATKLRQHSQMRRFTRLDETELLQPIPNGIIRTERTRTLLELLEGIKFCASEIGRILHVFFPTLVTTSPQANRQRVLLLTRMSSRPRCRARERVRL
jgi:hypothetical protein